MIVQMAGVYRLVLYLRRKSFAVLSACIQTAILIGHTLTPCQKKLMAWLYAMSAGFANRHCD
jgi:hypothetical protein